MKVKRSKRTRATNGSGTLVKHGKYYHARWYVGGKLVSKSLKTEDLDEAKDALERLSVPRAGQDERQTLRKIAQVMTATMTDITDRMKHVSIPVSDLYKLFAESPNRPAITAGTLHSYKGQFSVLTKWIQKRHPEITSARDISQAIADEYAAWRAETKSANTHNKDLNLFAQTWRILATRYGLDYNPWTDEHITRLKLKPNSRRNLTPDECRAIIAAATPEERTIIMVSLYTALRLGDVVRLRWSELDLDRLWINRIQIKTGKPVSVPLAPQLAKALRDWKKLEGESPSGFVFPKQVKRLKGDYGGTEAISRTFRCLFARAGIKTHSAAEDGKKFRDASFHSLRHTFVTSLMEAGVNPLIVQAAAGHSIMSTTAGYTHIGESALRAAIKKIAPVKMRTGVNVKTHERSARRDPERPIHTNARRA